MPIAHSRGVARANGIEIAYETHGSRGDRPLLLLRGLGTQLIQWSPALCRGLAEAGHFLVVFDNRDVGLSTHIREATPPTPGDVVAALGAGRQPDLPYTLDDMTDDTVGLMDALDLPVAHIAGISMGGMIVQATASRHPSRVKSLTSIMSSTGNRALPQADPEAMKVLMEPAERERSAWIEQSLRTQRVIGSPAYPTPDDEFRELAGRVFDRAFDPEGVARQMAAVLGAGDRRESLRKISTPTLVIHGADDPLIPLGGGEDTARCIPGARLEVIPGMGHDVPAALHERLLDLLAAHTAASD